MASMDETGGFVDMLGGGAQGAPQPGSPQGGMAPVVNGPDPVVQQLVNPPQNPEDFTTRVAKWNQLLQDPRLQNALLFFGASATAPLGYGESPMHRGLSALATGATAYQLTDLAGQQQDQARQKIAMEQQQTTANVRRLEAGTAREEQQTAQAAEAHPLNMDKARKEIEALDARIAAAKTEREKNELEIKKEKLLIGIQEKTGLDRAQAEVAVRRAQARQASAGADENLAQARGARAEAEQKERINELEKKILAKQPLTPEEKDVLARHRAGRGDPQSAQVLHDNYLREQIKTAFPELKTEQEISQKLLEFKKNQGVTLQSALKAREALADSGGDTSAADELIQQMLRSAGGTRAGAATQPVKTPTPALLSKTEAKRISGYEGWWKLGEDGKAVRVDQGERVSGGKIK